jgi:trigger factor
LGSGTFIDDFETQLIGHKAGDKVTVNVTFPDDYSNDPDLAGKDAVFKVTINGIYEAPEFTDEFVKENLSEYASTADEYREYIKQTRYDSNLESWIVKYLLDNTTVISYPKDYYEHLKSLEKYETEQSYQSTKSMYASLYPNLKYTFKDYVGMSEAKYDKSLDKIVEDTAKKALIYQAIYETEGLTASKDDYATYFDVDTVGNYDTAVQKKGVGAVMQEIIAQKVLDYLKGVVTVK